MLFFRDVGDRVPIRLAIEAIATYVLGKSGRADFVAMDAFMQDEHGVSIADVVRAAKTMARVSTEGDFVTVSIPSYVTEPKSGEPLGMLVRLAEYGDVEHAGTHLLAEAVEYTKSNIRYLALAEYIIGERENVSKHIRQSDS